MKFIMRLRVGIVFLPYRLLIKLYRVDVNLFTTVRESYKYLSNFLVYILQT